MLQCIRFQRLSLLKVILLLVTLVILLQLFHILLLSRLELATKDAKELKAVKSDDNSVYHDALSAMIHRVLNTNILDSSGTYHIIENIFAHDSSSSKDNLKRDVTVVTQTSSSNLHHLIALSERWKGPISVAVFTYDADVANTLFIMSVLWKCYQSISQTTKFHLVYPIKQPPPLDLQHALLDSHQTSCKNANLGNQQQQNFKLRGIKYPHNVLRNVARNSVQSEFMFMIDIDMIPSSNLHQNFKNFIEPNIHNLQQNTVYVIPAFEIKKSLPVPATKIELLHEWSSGNIQPFYYEACWKCQKHTDYNAWKEVNAEDLRVAYEVTWQDPWEPFYIAHHLAPLYDERFKQYGFNRISQVCELHVAGYKFGVLNNAFLVHQGFKIPGEFHETKDQELAENRLLFRKFKEELKIKYPNSSKRCY